MKIMDYHDWRQQQVANTKPTDLVFCPECEGEGEVFEECECCGHDKETACELCSGNGYIAFGRLRGKQREDCFLGQQYRETVKADLEKLAAWNGETLEEACERVGHEVGSKGRLVFPKFSFTEEKQEKRQ